MSCMHGLAAPHLAISFTTKQTRQSAMRRPAVSRAMGAAGGMTTLRLVLLLLLAAAAHCATAFVVPVPAPAARRTLVPVSAAAAEGSSNEDASAASSSSSSPMLSRRRRATPSSPSSNEASRAEALRRIGLVGLGAMMLGAPPARALDGGMGYMSVIEPSGKDKFFDFLQELKIELVGAKEEFEELPADESKKLLKLMDLPGAEKAYFALGCYWGAEATFRCTKGVVGTRVGFMGGTKPSPYYEDIKDHMEAIEVTYLGGDATYERLLKVCGRTYDFVDVGPRYARKIFTTSSGQRSLASKRGQTWSSMPVGDAAVTFFTPAKLDHQAYSKPRCDDAAPNLQLVMNGLRRKTDHYHYASDCPTCTLADSDEGR